MPKLTRLELDLDPMTMKFKCNTYKAQNKSFSLGDVTVIWSNLQPSHKNTGLSKAKSKGKQYSVHLAKQITETTNNEVNTK